MAVSGANRADLVSVDFSKCLNVNLRGNSSAFYPKMWHMENQWPHFIHLPFPFTLLNHLSFSSLPLICHHLLPFLTPALFFFCWLSRVLSVHNISLFLSDSSWMEATGRVQEQKMERERDQTAKSQVKPYFQSHRPHACPHPHLPQFAALPFCLIFEKAFIPEFLCALMNNTWASAPEVSLFALYLHPFLCWENTHKHRHTHTHTHT